MCGVGCAVFCSVESAARAPRIVSCRAGENAVTRARAGGRRADADIPKRRHIHHLLSVFTFQIWWDISRNSDGEWGSLLSFVRPPIESERPKSNPDSHAMQIHDDDEEEEEEEEEESSQNRND